MSKAVLLSVRPRWCGLIASGKKTIEVRKTRPKIETPFKCYIYQTMIGYVSKSKENDMLVPVTYGKVIGEFVCDAVIPMYIKYSNPDSHLALREFPYTCLTDKEIIDYLGNGGDGYGWHISDLVIYDEPKVLSEFRRREPLKNKNGEIIDEWHSLLTRPPQSWCYVEELT